VSLQNLRTTYLDCLVLHSPLPRMEQTLEVWRAMEALVDSGGVRQLGISNCYQLEQLRALHHSARVKPSVLQNRFSAHTDYDVALRELCREQSVVYQSFWTLTASPLLLTHAVIAGLATRYQRTAAQIMFRFLSQQSVVPLSGTRSEVHMREDLSIFDFA